MSLARYKRSICVARPDQTVAEAARIMRDQRVGCVVVVRDGHPLGLLTDRDLALRVVADGSDPKRTLVSDVLTYAPITVRETDGVQTAVARMREHGVRRLPIVDDHDRVVGIVTADDLVMLIGEELAGLTQGIEQSADSFDTR
jgi:CBS domain-containing protein